MRRAEATGDCSQQLSRREYAAYSINIFLLSSCSVSCNLFFFSSPPRRMRMDKDLYYY